MSSAVLAEAARSAWYARVERSCDESSTWARTASRRECALSPPEAVAEAELYIARRERGWRLLLDLLEGRLGEHDVVGGEPAARSTVQRLRVVPAPDTGRLAGRLEDVLLADVRPLDVLATLEAVQILVRGVGARHRHGSDAR